MNILFFLMWGLACAFLIFWLKPAQVEASQSTSVAPVPTPTSTARGNQEGIPVNNFNLDFFNKASQSVIMQKQILINLKIMEYELAKLEHFLKTKDFQGTLKVHPKTQTQ